MAFTSTSIGDIGKLGIDKLFLVESKKYRDDSEVIVGNILKTRESYYKMKSLAGFGPAEDFAEGATAPIDDYQALFTKNFYPERIGKAIEISDVIEWQDQYKIIMGLQPEMAKSFVIKQNMIAASLDNLGFSSTTMGINAGETLYSASHSNNGYAGSNVSSTGTSVAFGPLGVAGMKTDLRNQVSARGDIMSSSDEIICKVPNNLWDRAWAMQSSEKLVGTNNNDKNYARQDVTFERIKWYTSPTAWFARLKDNDEHGLFMIHFKPYSLEKLAKDDRLFNRYIASQMLLAGWRDFHGTWGTPGA